MTMRPHNNNNNNSNNNNNNNSNNNNNNNSTPARDGALLWPATFVGTLRGFNVAALRPESAVPQGSSKERTISGGTRGE